MTESHKNRPEDHTPAPDVYNGFDALCAAMGLSILLVGIAATVVAVQTPAEQSLAAGCTGIVLGLALLLIARTFNARPRDNRHP